MDFPAQDRVTVEVSDTQRHLRIDAAELQRWVRGALRLEGVAHAEISLAVVDNATIRVLNNRHLDHDWPTDVIAFRLSDPDGPVLIGELIVSAEMARTTARQAGTDPAAELALYIVHGLLHLCGFDDRDADATATMRRRESEALEALEMPNTFDSIATATAAEGLPCSA